MAENPVSAQEIEGLVGSIGKLRELHEEMQRWRAPKLAVLQ
jgi:hypothetical protein